MIHDAESSVYCAVVTVWVCGYSEWMQSSELLYLMWAVHNDKFTDLMTMYNCYLWPPCVADADIISLLCGFFCLLFSLAYSQPSQIGCLPYFYTWCGFSANLGCRSETCCTQLAENTGHKKSTSVHHRTTLSGSIFTTKTRIDNRKKTC